MKTDACQYIVNCPFFNGTLGNFPKTVQQLKEMFCLKEFSRCARYAVREAGLQVPANLFPSEHERADAIIRMGGVD